VPCTAAAVTVDVVGVVWAVGFELPPPLQAVNVNATMIVTNNGMKIFRMLNLLYLIFFIQGSYSQNSFQNYLDATSKDLKNSLSLTILLTVSAKRSFERFFCIVA
jgi:hypothetical protein